jgi:hypothetical protein
MQIETPPWWYEETSLLNATKPWFLSLMQANRNIHTDRRNQGHQNSSRQKYEVVQGFCLYRILYSRGSRFGAQSLLSTRLFGVRRKNTCHIFQKEKPKRSFYLNLRMIKTLINLMNLTICTPMIWDINNVILIKMYIIKMCPTTIRPNNNNSNFI